MALQATDFMDAVPLLQIDLIFCSAQLFEYMRRVDHAYWIVFCKTYVDDRSSELSVADIISQSFAGHLA